MKTPVNLNAYILGLEITVKTLTGKIKLLEAALDKERAQSEKSVREMEGRIILLEAGYKESGDRKAYKYKLIFNFENQTIQPGYNAFCIKCPPRPLCCTVLKIRRACLRPCAVRLSTGIYAQNLRPQGKMDFTAL